MHNLTLTGGVVAVSALLVVLAGCGSSPAGKSATCFTGRYQLTAQTLSARPGAQVTLAANGPTAPDQAQWKAGASSRPPQAIRCGTLRL
jgi:hypothetical protein